MKEERFEIQHMDRIRDALNEKLNQALALMSQKDASEAEVTLKINLEMRGDMYSWLPIIKWKTSLKVPMQISDTGTEGMVSRVYWDQERAAYMMEIEGVQERIG